MGKKKDKPEIFKRNKINCMVLLSTLVLIISLFGITSVQGNSCSASNTYIRGDTESNDDDDIFDQYEPLTNYNSSQISNNAGMEGIYNVANSMIHSLIPDILPDNWITVNNGVIEIKDDDYFGLLQEYMGYLVFLCILLIIAFLVPIVGICFCICRCCGSCGAKVEPSDKRNDHWPKAILAVLLLIVNILFLFGMVGAFGTNEQLKQGTDKLVGNVDTSIEDALAFLKDVSKHVDHIATNNLGAFSTKLSDTLGNTGDILFEEVAEMTNMDFAFQAFELTEQFDPIKKKLKTLDGSTKKIKAQAMQMNDATRSIREQLKPIAESCTNQICAPIQSILSGLAINLDLNSIPNVEDVILAMEDLDVEHQMKDAKKQLEDAKQEIQRTIQGTIGDIQHDIETTTTDVGKESKKVKKLIEDISKQVKEFSSDNLETIQEFISDYSIYLYIVGLVVSILLLLITTSIFLGIIFGFFGVRPKKDKTSCCNKSIGNGFLVFAVVMMFLTTTAMVVVLITSNVAIFPKLLICDPLRNPDDSSVIDFINDLLNFEELGEDVTITSIFTTCQNNTSAYTAFNIKAKFDICQLRDKIDDLDIDGKMDEIEALLEFKEPEFKEFVRNLNMDEAITALKDIRDNSNLEEINEDNFEFEFDSINLEELSATLDDLISKLNFLEPSLASELKLINLRIKAYIKYLFEPMKDNAEDILEQVKGILKDLNSEDTGFEETINELIDKIGNIKQELGKIDFTEQIMPIVDEFSKEILNQTNKFVNFAIKTVEEDMGKCKPFSDSVNSLLVATCDNIFQPMNGLWFSIFWCLVMYIPMMILSLKLGSYYKRYKVEEQPTQFLYPNNVNAGNNYRFNPAAKNTQDYYY